MILTCGELAGVVCDDCGRAFAIKVKNVPAEFFALSMHVCYQCHDKRMKSEQGIDKAGGQADTRQAP